MHAILLACDRGMGSRLLFEACERDLADSIAIVVTVNADIPTPQLSVTGGDNRSDQSWQHHLCPWPSHLTIFQVSRMS